MINIRQITKFFAFEWFKTLFFLSFFFWNSYFVDYVLQTWLTKLELKNLYLIKTFKLNKKIKKSELHVLIDDKKLTWCMLSFIS